MTTEGLHAGEALITWQTPADRGAGKALGFECRFLTGPNAAAVPRYLIPMARRPGAEVRMHLRDLGFAPGEKIGLSIRPVDGAGNVGEPCTRQISVASGEKPLHVPDPGIKPFPADSNLPAAGPVRVAVVDLLDKIDPASGRMIPEQPKGYKGGNHLFSAARRLVRLQAARNETVCFQLNLEGQSEGIRVEYAFESDFRLKPKLLQFAYVEEVDKAGRPAGALPDPLLPLRGPVSIPSKAGEVLPRGQKNISLIGELYVPHDEPAGVKRGKITVAAGGKSFTSMWSSRSGISRFPTNSPSCRR